MPFASNAARPPQLRQPGGGIREVYPSPFREQRIAGAASAAGILLQDGAIDEIGDVAQGGVG
jgi:hypothetical protein